MRAIGEIGHTVMMLSPWNKPIPLTRAWCLWELYGTVHSRATFSVCLGPDEQRQFEDAILANFDIVFDVFSKISVKDAEAGNPEDQANILGEVERTVGFTRLNAIAFEQMRIWIFGVCRKIADEAEGVDNLWKKQQIANLMQKFQLGC